MKIVFDTNILISALIKTGKPRELLHKITEKKALVLSNDILEEFATVTQDAKIRKYFTEEDVAIFPSFLGTVAKIVKVSSKFDVADKDPADVVILRTAYDAKATCIVAGDKHLLSLGEFRGIQIVTIDEMLKLLKTKKPRKNGKKLSPKRSSI